jgi:predicted dehydrogenase
MTKLRVGIVGAGSIAKSCHAPGYAASDDCELVAIADISEKSLEMMRKEYKFAKEYRDYREMLKNEELDVVSVCTPNKFHSEIAIAALEAGCDVLLEKPIALSMGEGEAIKAAIEDSGKRLGVCFSHRFNDLVRLAQKALAEKMIGEVFMIKVRFAHSGPFPGWASSDWFYNPELAGGGAMLDMAVHAVDIIQYLIGPITAINAMIATLRKDIAVDDNVVGSVRIGDRCMGYFECGWTSTAGSSGIEIMGDNGAIFADYATGKTTVRFGAMSPTGEFQIEEKLLGEAKTSHWTTEMKEFIAKLKNGEELPTNIDDGLSALKVTLAAYESNATGKQVKL